MPIDFRNIDFENTKKSIIDYLKATDEFKDYDFTGSALNVLVDALAYTSTYMQIYSNFSLNESFLDTAQKRSSVVSHAKSIGYIPYQYTPSRAKLKMIYREVGDPDFTYVPSGTKFMATNENNVYYFETREDFPLETDKNGTHYAIVEIYEGRSLLEKWTQDFYYTTRYVIAQPKIDLASLRVTVYETEYDTEGEEFSVMKDSTQLAPQEKTFFVQENFNGNVELTFGDNVMARKLQPGNVIVATFNSCVGSEANGINEFQFLGFGSETHGLQVWDLEVLETSYGGGDVQETEEIRNLAPKFYQRQNRNVVAQDYAVHILSELGGWIEAVNTWGGEDNVPPQYGKVFVAVKPKNNLYLSDVQKDEILKLLRSRMIVCFTPEIVEPYPIYHDMTLTVNFDRKGSYRSKKQIEQMVREKIETYYKEKIQKLNTPFLYSSLNSLVDNIDESLNGSDIEIVFDIKFKPESNIKKTYIMNFFNRVEKNSVRIETWNIIGSVNKGRIEDDGKGNLVYYVDSDIYNDKVGSVDYEKGIVTIENFNFKITPETVLSCFARPFSKNNYVERNAMFLLGDLTIVINE